MKITPLLPALSLTFGLATACDNGTTSALLPLYVAPVIDGSTVFMVDAGHDAPLADGTATDARADATPPVDAPHETSTAGDAHAGDAHADDAQADDAHPADAGTDAVTPDASDAAKPDASDAAVADASDAALLDAATSTCSVEAGTCTPVCTGTGATLGWYLGGTLLCTDACTGLVPKCEYVGQPQQGWYTTSGHGCPPHVTEIVNDPTCN